MSVIPDIERLFKAAHSCNLVHFPQAMLLWRSPGTAWCVALTKDDTASTSSLSAHASGPTPEAAIAALAKRLSEMADERVTSLRRDLASAESVLGDVATLTPGARP